MMNMAKKNKGKHMEWVVFFVREMDWKLCVISAV